MKQLRNTQNASSIFDNPLWTVKQAAVKLSVSEATLRDWIYKRQIPFKRVGNLIRFDPFEIHCWVQERTQHGY